MPRLIQIQTYTRSDTHGNQQLSFFMTPSRSFFSEMQAGQGFEEGMAMMSSRENITKTSLGKGWFTTKWSLTEYELVPAADKIVTGIC